MNLNLLKILGILILVFSLNSCKGGDARKNPPNPELRVKKNLEEGKGFRLNDALNKTLKGGGGTFDFASSNELWRASLDIINFMPLLSANYSGGIIITDWYSENQNESIKVTIRFLSNEVRSDALDIIVFLKKCADILNCKISKSEGSIGKELKKEILKRATIYKKQNKDKNFKPYSNDLK
tara:strand:+ start:196 stop:738 length:543 start_codon:yes stop_codon:yes gene_type:complete